MAVLQLEVSERLVSSMGLDALQKKINQLLDLQELHLMALEIREQLKKDGLDQDNLLKDAKRRAWEKFKANQPKEILP
jgi:hypothetical protein